MNPLQTSSPRASKAAPVARRELERRNGRLLAGPRLALLARGVESGGYFGADLD